MAKVGPAESPVESASGAANQDVTEAFGLLSDETRLAILLALWEEYDPHSDQNAVPFSRIFDRLEYDDPGNLRYHLQQLQGQFLTQEAAGEGYELRETGMKLVRTIFAGAGVDDLTMAPTEIDQPCLRCGARTDISYRDGCLIWACTECDGPMPGVTDVDGFLSATPFDPAGLSDRTAEEIRLASIATARKKKQLMFDGFCPDCSGAVESWLDMCPNHDEDGICETCGKIYAVWARFTCQVCKRHDISSPKTLALFHPAVISFYDDHGVPIRIHANDFETAQTVFDHMHNHEMTLRDEEPSRVQVTAALDGDTVDVTFDETVSVVDISR